MSRARTQQLLEKQIEYIRGDMFKPGVIPKHGEIMIPHVCNDIGAWGAGFVVPLAKNFPKAERAYREFFKTKKCDQTNEPFELGSVQFVEADTIEYNDEEGRIVWVANMIAQHGLIGPTNPQPIDYEALETCIQKVASHCDEHTHIYAPKFGAGLAGGKWEIIEQMIVKHWLHHPKGVKEIKVFYI